MKNDWDGVFVRNIKYNCEVIIQWKFPGMNMTTMYIANTCGCVVVFLGW